MPVTGEVRLIGHPARDFDRRELLQGLAAAAALSGVVVPAAATSSSADPQTVRVPLDHRDPAAGAVELAYEWGAPYRPDRATVLLVADAQQFYLRPGAAADLQSKLFGPQVNVLALFGRAASPQVQAFVRPGAATDWARASRVLNVHQWIADLRLVADSLELRPEKFALYGRSGGADLVLRFLATHPRRAFRAYVQAAVTHDLAVRWGVSADRFWEELVGRYPGVADRLAAFLAARPELRREAILLIQRQNFYEPLETLPEARVALIETILKEDRPAISTFRDRYQLEALEAMHARGDNLSPVRLHEFSRSYRDPRGRAPPLRPDVEAIFYYAEPIERTVYDSQVPAPQPDLDGLRQAATEVLIVAGRHDHTSDYRTQIGLAGLIPRSELLLLEDDHIFTRLAASGKHPALLQAFFSSGRGSPAFANAVAALAPLRSDEIG